MVLSLLSFALLTAVPAVSTDAAQPAPSKLADKMICRREAPIGSLIANRKTCMTAKQWQARADNGNAEARKLMYDNMARNPTPSN